MIFKIYLEWIYGYHKNNTVQKKLEYNHYLLTKYIFRCLNKPSLKEQNKSQECRKSHIYFKIDDIICLSILNEH